MESGRKNIRLELLNGREEKIMLWMSHLAVPAGKGKQKVWGELEKIILAREHTTVKIRPMWFKWSARIAASLVLLAGIYFVFTQAANKSIETLRGEQVVFYLPDSSKVIMNADSRVTYNSLFWKKNRKIQLEGEAFFEVNKGKNFQVISRNGVVEVLGTSFNIFARENKYIVNCMSGKVKVSNKDHDDFKILTPGLSTSLENNQLQLISGGRPDKAAAWARGEFYFETVPLKEVFEELERQYDIRILSNETIDRRLYTGFFLSEDKLENSLELILSPMGLRYETVGEKEIKILRENI